MLTAFPISLHAVYTGKSGKGGEFKDSETGDNVSYAELHSFDFDTADGTVSRINLRANRIDEVAEGFDVSKLVRYQDRVMIEGDVVLREGGKGYFRPSKITRAKAPASGA